MSLDVKPNDATLVSMMSACSKLGDLELGKWVHLYLADLELGKWVLQMQQTTGINKMLMLKQFDCYVCKMLCDHKYGGCI